MYKVYSIRLTADFLLETMGSRKQWDEIKDDLNKWEDVLCSWIGRPNIVKMSVPPKFLYRLNAFKTKICFYCRCRNWQADLKILYSCSYGNAKDPEWAKQSLKRTKVGDSQSSTSKLTIKPCYSRVWWWHKDKFVCVFIYVYINGIELKVQK